MIITIIFDHPPDVALSPTHLVFFLVLSFPFEPPLQTKASAKQMFLPLKGDFIDCPLPAIDTYFLLVQGCSKICKVAQGLVPLTFGALCCCVLPLLPLLLSRTGEGESALRSLLSFLFCLLAHGPSTFLLALPLRFSFDTQSHLD